MENVIGPPPEWVTPLPAPLADRLPGENHKDGVGYLLVDRQWRIDHTRHSRFHHYVSKALNSSGVEAVSHIAIAFDPEYETVTLHQVDIVRDGRRIDRRDRLQMNLIQREKELEYQIYDGIKTLNIFVEDVRVDDIVAYSFTIEGVNPVFSGHFYEELEMGWQVPLGGLHYRVLWASARPLQIRNKGTAIVPARSTVGRYLEYVWQLDDIEALVRDPDTPGWYDPFPAVQLSDMASWAAVADWALPLYTPQTGTPAQRTVLEPILKSAGTPEEKTLGALHFVQDEVRYLGIEMGTGSHEPRHPDQVIDNRFGDCKDKSRLLVSLLGGMGIEAHAALVNTRRGRRIKDDLPTPKAFNHVIVLARIDGRTYWLDPTRTHQGGRLDTLHQPDYAYALVISENSQGLVNMFAGATAVSTKRIEETFDIRDAMDRPAAYRIASHHERFYAESLRADLSETNLKELQQSYLNYTAVYYPDVQVADPLQLSDDRASNRVTVSEAYAIPRIWTQSDDARYVNADFEPFLINDHVKAVASLVRTMPYAVAHPVRYHQTTRILVPDGSTFDAEFFEIRDKAFRFTKRVDFADDVLVIEYAYESLKDHVDARDIQDYANHVREVRSLSSYQMQMTDPAIDFGTYHFAVDDLNWPMVIVTLLALCGAVLLCFRFIHLYDPHYYPPGNVDSRLAGIGGWLILLAFGLLATPLRIAADSKDLWYVYSSLQASILSDQYGMGMLAVIAGEIVGNIAMVVAMLFIIGLFFARRHTFPRALIGFFLLSFVFWGADTLATRHFLPPEEIDPADAGQRLRMGIGAVIWSLYLRKSERVRATFTRRRGNRAGEHPRDVAGSDEKESAHRYYEPAGEATRAD